MCLLVFLGADCEQAKRLFQASDRWTKERAGEKGKDYVDRTLAAAFIKQTERFTPSKHKQSTCGMGNGTAKSGSNQTEAAPPDDESVVSSARADAELLRALNEHLVLAKRLSITRAWRRGDSLYAATACGVFSLDASARADWRKGRDAIWGATNIWLRDAAKTQQLAWANFVYHLAELAARDSVVLEAAAIEEMQAHLRLIWDMSSGFRVQTDDDWATLSGRLALPRNPQMQSDLPPAVFVADNCCWLHLDTFRRWISIPSATNRDLALDWCRGALYGLGFERVRRRIANRQWRLWRGPLNVLEGDDG